MKKLFLILSVLFSFSFLYSEVSTEDTLSILNENDCYNTGNCHYRLIFATGAIMIYHKQFILIFTKILLS